jgi:hypothetical protein
MAKIDLERPEPRVLRLLDGSSLDRKIGLTLQLVSVDAHGTPHVALLSAGEVLAVGDHRIHLALYPTSATAANLRNHRQALLSLVLDGANMGHLLTVRSTRAAVVAGRELTLVTTDVTAVWRDEVPYAELTSGTTYRLLGDPAPTLERWGETLAQLRRR